MWGEPYEDVEHHIKHWACDGAEGRLNAAISKLPRVVTRDPEAPWPRFEASEWRKTWLGSHRDARSGSAPVDVISCDFSLLVGGTDPSPWSVEIRRPVRFDSTRWRGRSTKRVSPVFFSHAVRHTPTGLGDYDNAISLLIGRCESWRDAALQVRDVFDPTALAATFGRQVYDRRGWTEVRETYQDRYTMPGTPDARPHWKATENGAEPIATIRVDDAQHTAQKLLHEAGMGKQLIMGPLADGTAFALSGYTGDRHPIDFAVWCADVISSADDYTEQ